MKILRISGFMLLWLIIYCPISQAQEADDTPSKWSFNGYTKFLQTSNYTPAFSTLTTNNLLHNRLNIRWYPHQNWTVAVEARNRIIWGEEVKLTPNYGTLIDQYNGLVDLSVLWEGSGIIAHSMLDRAYVEFVKGKFEARLGRQRINWGINTIWNPNDLFNAYNFLDFDYEERPGSDALRLTYYGGMLSSAEIAFAPARDIKESVVAGIYKFNKWNYDVQLLGGYYRGDIAMGLGWAGSIKGMGFKGEMTYFTPTSNSTDSLGLVSLSAGVDYQLNKGPFVSAGVYYNSRGLSQLSVTDLQSGLIGAQLTPKALFPAKWSFLAGANGQLTPLWTVGASAIYAPAGNLMAFIPTVTYSIKENWDIDLISQAFFLQDSSAYQNLGTSVYLRLKWSF